MHMVLEWKVLKLIDLIYIIVFIFTVDFVQFLVVLLKIASSWLIQPPEIKDEIKYMYKCSNFLSRDIQYML
jgi:hypothetical protein